MALLRNSAAPGTAEPACVPISPCLRAESGDQAPLKPTAPSTVSFPPDSNAQVNAEAPGRPANRPFPSQRCRHSGCDGLG